jgi:cyanophycinase-like exopeptidase
VEENAAVLIGADGRATVVGFGPAYFLEANTPPAGCKDKMPLTCRNISVHVAVTGSTFDVKNWKAKVAMTIRFRSNAGQVSAAGSSHGVF